MTRPQGNLPKRNAIFFLENYNWLSLTERKGMAPVRFHVPIFLFLLATAIELEPAKNNSSQSNGN
jgi:hypothetical protein